MARVRSISNHPYGGAMRVKGIEYDIQDDQSAELLVSLGRVVRVGETPDVRTYATRELQASTPRTGAILGTTGTFSASRAKNDSKRAATRSNDDLPAPPPSTRSSGTGAQSDDEK